MTASVPFLDERGTKFWINRCISKISEEILGQLDNVDCDYLLIDSDFVENILKTRKDWNLKNMFKKTPMIF